MAITFPLILVSAVFITGLIALYDACIGKKKREPGTSPSRLVEYAKAFFPILLIVLLIRSFLFSPYRVPTGSLEPTIMPGDLIVVSKYAYGLRLPVIGTKILSTGTPKRGDVVVFHWPVDPSFVYAKRLVGLPGDHLQYRNKTLIINGKPAVQSLIGDAYDREPGEIAIPALKVRESLGGVLHAILLHQTGGQSSSFDVVVPPGHYFMMGDNRDNSADSRVWGPVPEKYLIGKGEFVWMSWDSNQFRVRWHRIGLSIH